MYDRPDSRPAQEATHILQDDVESRDTVRSDKEQFIRVLLVWKRVDIPDFAFGKELELGQVCLRDLHISRWPPGSQTGKEPQSDGRRDSRISDLIHSHRRLRCRYRSQQRRESPPPQPAEFASIALQRLVPPPEQPSLLPFPPPSGRATRLALHL